MPERLLTRFPLDGEFMGGWEAGGTGVLSTGMLSAEIVSSGIFVVHFAGITLTWILSTGILPDLPGQTSCGVHGPCIYWHAM